MSILEDRDIECVEAGRVRNNLGGHYFLSCNCELKHSGQLSILNENDPDIAIDERWLHEGSHPRKSDCTFGPIRRTADFGRSSGASGEFIQANDHVRVEHCDESFKIALTHCPQKSVNNSALASDLRLRRPFALDTATGAACQLSGGNRRSSDYIRNFRKGHIEHVM